MCCEHKMESSFLMIERLVEMQWPVLTVFGDKDIVSSSKVQSLSLKTSEWEIMIQPIPTLQLFPKVTDVLGAEKLEK